MVMLKEYTTMLSACVAAAYGGFLFYKFYTTRSEEKKKEADTNLLPLEIFGEILPYMDVKDVLRYRSVCKQWNTLIQSRYFAKKYAMHKPTTYTCGVLLNKNCRFKKNKNVFLVATCDGLHLQMELTNQRPWLTSLILSPMWEYALFIRNQTTHQSLPIPRPTAAVEKWWGKLYAFVFIPSTFEYKVVCFNIDRNSKKCCFVITLEKDEKKWRSLDIPRNPQNQLIRYQGTKRRIVEIGADVHCIRYVKMGSRYAYEIVSLDLETEYFSILNVYKDFISDKKDVWPIRWNESLAFVHMDKKELIVKVLEDYRKEKWGEQFAVALTFLEDEKKISKEFVPIIANKGLLWLRLDKDKEICYDLEKKGITQTTACKRYWNDDRVYDDMSSVVSLKGMQPL